MNVLENDIRDAIDDLSDQAALHARDIAKTHGSFEAAVHDAIIKGFKKSAHAGRPDIYDSRTGLWRCRFMLRPEGQSMREFAYDSDAPRPLYDGDSDMIPGAALIRGLPDVAYQLACRAEEFHAGREIVGLDELTLRHSLKAFRVALSRQGGKSIWRPRYRLQAVEGAVISQPNVRSLKGLTRDSRDEVTWVAEVYICRESDTAP